MGILAVSASNILSSDKTVLESAPEVGQQILLTISISLFSAFTGIFGLQIQLNSAVVHRYKILNPESVIISFSPAAEAEPPINSADSSAELCVLE